MVVNGEVNGDKIASAFDIGLDGVEVVDDCAAPLLVEAEFWPPASLSGSMVLDTRLTTRFAVSSSSSDGGVEGTCMPIERTPGALVFGFEVLAFRLPLPPPEVDRAEAFLEADVGLSTPVGGVGSGGDARVVRVWSGEDGLAACGDEALADGRRDGPFRFFALMVDSSALLLCAPLLLLSASTGMRASGRKRVVQV